MAKAKKLKSGTWRVLVFSHFEQVDGVKKRRYESFTAPTKAEAELKAAQFANNKDRIRSGKLTVGDAIERYISSRKNTLSPSTLKTYKADAAKCQGLLFKPGDKALQRVER